MQEPIWSSVSVNLENSESGVDQSRRSLATVQHNVEHDHGHPVSSQVTSKQLFIQGVGDRSMIKQLYEGQTIYQHSYEGQVIYQQVQGGSEQPMWSAEGLRKRGRPSSRLVSAQGQHPENLKDQVQHYDFVPSQGESPRYCQVEGTVMKHNEPGNFTCLLCGKSYRYKHYLRKHERMHAGDLPYACEYCTKRFTSASELTTHMRLHTNDRPFTCKQCGKGFRQAGALTMHMRFHSDYRPFPCPRCPARFYSNPDLNKHIRCTHDKIRDYACTICGQKFLQNSSRVAHERVHMGIKPFECKHCQRRYARLNQLRLHEARHTGIRPFACEICEKRYPNMSLLQRHVKMCHDVIKEHVCDICDKAFPLSYQLKNHKRFKHDNERPYCCLECHKTFHTKFHLHAHELVHVNGKPFQCQRCSKDFRTAETLAAHYRNTHHCVNVTAKAVRLMEELMRDNAHLTTASNTSIIIEAGGSRKVVKIADNKLRGVSQCDIISALELSNGGNAGLDLVSGSITNKVETLESNFEASDSVQDDSLVGDDLSTVKDEASLLSQRPRARVVKLINLKRLPLASKKENSTQYEVESKAVPDHGNGEVMLDFVSGELQHSKESNVRDFGADSGSSVSETWIDNDINKTCRDEINMIRANLIESGCANVECNLINVSKMDCRSTECSQSTVTENNCTNVNYGACALMEPGGINIDYAQSITAEAIGVNENLNQTALMPQSDSVPSFQTAGSYTDSKSSLLLTSLNAAEVEQPQIVEHAPCMEQSELMEQVFAQDAKQPQFIELILPDGSQVSGYVVCSAEGLQEIFVSGDTSAASLECLLSLTSQNGLPRTTEIINEIECFSQSISDNLPVSSVSHIGITAPNNVDGVSLNAVDTFNHDSINVVEQTNKKIDCCNSKIVSVSSGQTNYKIENESLSANLSAQFDSRLTGRQVINMTETKDGRYCTEDDDDIYYDPPGNANSVVCDDVDQCRYRCRHCDKSYRRRSYLLAHERIHTVDAHSGSNEHACKRCDKSFHSSLVLIAHERSAHSDIKPFICSYCKQRYRTRAHLKSHELIHIDVRAYVCRRCGKRFKHASAARIHARTHSSERPYSCSQCELTFKQRSTLRSHELIHSGVRPYRCATCGADFYRRHALREHELVHGDWEYKCELCGYTYAQKRLLKRHMLTHVRELTGREGWKRRMSVAGRGASSQQDSEESSSNINRNSNKNLRDNSNGNPSDPPSLNLSDKTVDNLNSRAANNCYLNRSCDSNDVTVSKRRSRLVAPVRHLVRFPRRSHMKTRSLTCEHCGKTFTRSAQLRAHERCHSGVKPYVCERCDKRYADQSQLSRHCRLVHGRGLSSGGLSASSLVDGMPRVFSPSDRYRKAALNAIDDQHLMEDVAADETTLPHLASQVMPYECGICRSQFSQLLVLQRHIRVYHDVGSNKHSDICGGGDFKLRVKPNADVSRRSNESGSDAVKVLSKSRTRSLSASTSNKRRSSAELNKSQTDANQLKTAELCLLFGSPGSVGQDDSKARLREDIIRYAATDAVRNSQDMMIDTAASDGQEVYLLSCAKCLKAFDTEAELAAHDCVVLEFDGAAGGDKKFVCMLCGNRYLIKASLMKHIKRAHSSAANVRWRLQSELPRVDEKPTISSDGIEESCLGLASVEVVNMGRTEMFKCDECDTMFKDIENLKAHKFKHAGELKPYLCSHCGKRFSTKGCWRQHLPQHRQELRFTCSTCHRNFPRLDSLRQHEILHDNARPFVCKLCDKSYPYYIGLRRHLKSAHKLKVLHENNGSKFKSATNILSSTTVLSPDLNSNLSNRSVSCRNELVSESSIDQLSDERLLVIENMKQELLLEELSNEDMENEVICAECACVFSGMPQLVKHLRLQHGLNAGDDDDDEG